MNFKFWLDGPCTNYGTLMPSLLWQWMWSQLGLAMRLVFVYIWVLGCSNIALIPMVLSTSCKIKGSKEMTKLWTTNENISFGKKERKKNYANKRVLVTSLLFDTVTWFMRLYLDHAESNIIRFRYDIYLALFCISCCLLISTCTSWYSSAKENLSAFAMENWSSLSLLNLMRDISLC